MLCNILFDQDYNQVGVVDWEWSRLVPAQFMALPTWLLASQLEWVMLGPMSKAYLTQVSYLRAAVQECEKALGVPPLLSTEWAPHETWCHTTIVIGLNYPGHIYLVYWNLIFRKLVSRICGGTDEQLDQQYESEIRKVREQLNYFESEKEHYGHKTPRGIIERVYWS
ncbi:hypothetical protein N657DRAFT_652936 [Parathielavia appendiculata]|uniref:Aminoglycoside phosphotransferase domain-containing protein n=1 Tax=Parathielavia appendiculata TaxID=2587402 RepID=A0AAN6UAS0_9PEZI|nr:hypothetical protein N657DRAFT_652936 [Parathielavia appendiculata]